MWLKIVKKALDKRVEATIYGFVYDNSKVKVKRDKFRTLRK